MAIEKFIPKVWSARLMDQMHKCLVFGKLCNRHWEGDISEYGDTVHINTLSDVTVKPYVPGEDIDDPEELTGTDIKLVIDHAAYCNFFIEDVDAVQSRADVMDAAMRSAAVKMAEDSEAYILSVIRSGAGATQNVTAGADGTYGLLVQMKTKLDQLNVPRVGRKLVMPATFEAELLLDNRFVSGNGAFSQAVLSEGAVARAAGFDIYISNDLTDEMIAMTEESVTFAQQITKMEAYRREKAFGDGVKGLSLCGAKVVQPDSVCVFKVTK